MSDTKTQRPYPQVEQQPDLPALERAVLERWKSDRTFLRSIEGRPEGERGENEFVFYDGPPFANGLPHYGHLLTGYVKDIVPRYQTMRGRRVDRRWGWDCHGLPAELAAEKQLGVGGREQILEYGIEKFNDACQTSVLRYAEEWQSFITRQARWVDFSRDYKTMDASYMESVMWAQKQLWDKGLLYEGYRVMPYSWAMQTPVSNFETRMDDSYRERQDPAVTVRFELTPVEGDEAPLEVWAWTTTPWTLPSNLALAVGPEIDYALYEVDGKRAILGAAAAAKYAKELGDAPQVGTLRGSELVGRRYTPMFPYFADRTDSFRILGADFVDTQEGTGVVHMAPGFGEDDMATCQANDIGVVCPVDDAGQYTSEVSDYVGQNVLAANPQIIKDLKARGIVVRHETYLHNYPHCWRTGEPLIYRALSSWYVKVSAIRDRMVELNQQIRWVPEHIRDGQFGKWLEGARDWSISRNRFWGSPIPIWKSDDPAYPRVDVYGSLDELERDFGVRPENLHRPFIDELTRPNPDDPTGKSTMRRVPDVLDCWFESGSMPYAQVHYPFENREWFEEHFPADFIVEYHAQTRGWFYTLMVLSTALFDRPPFKNCMCHGVVVDEDGLKLSKSKNNYPSPTKVYDTLGADALRWHLVSSPVLRGLDVGISREGKEISEVLRLVVNPIWNAWYFFSLYANTDGIRGTWRTDSTGVLDRYVLGKTRQLVEVVQGQMDSYDLAGACATITGFLDVLNNWYVRRSRDRFWRAEIDDDKRDAYDTLYTVLQTLCRVIAPLLPMISEEIYRGLTGEESVHLSDWPDAEAFPEDTALLAAMDRVRDACSSARMLREAKSLRVRQPLATLTIAGTGAESLLEFAGILKDEVNVKQVEVAQDLEAFASFTLAVNARALGPRLGKGMKTVISAAKAGRWTSLPDGRVEVEGEVLSPDSEFTLRLEPKDGVLCQALDSNDAIVVLDPVLTPELEREGLIRDLARALQEARKATGLHVSDRIALRIAAPTDTWRLAIEEHRDFLVRQLLANDLSLAENLGSDDSVRSATIGSDTLSFTLVKAQP